MRKHYRYNGSFNLNLNKNHEDEISLLALTNIEALAENGEVTVKLNDGFKTTYESLSGLKNSCKTSPFKTCKAFSCKEV